MFFECFVFTVFICSFKSSLILFWVARNILRFCMSWIACVSDIVCRNCDALNSDKSGSVLYAIDKNVTF